MDVIGYQGSPVPRVQLDSRQFDATTVCDIPPPPPPPPGWQPPPDGGTTWFDPLVLDVTGDGIRTTGLDRLVSFDIDGNGRKEWITWTDPASFDAFLWIDLFGKNRVDNGSELFGVGTVLPDGSKAKDGFEALAIYDAPARGGNGDGLIDSHDRVWPKLRLWVDLNHNGVCEPWETWPVPASSIDGISLATVRSTTIDSSGNTHFLHGTYWRRTGRGAQTFSVDSIGFRGQ
jgi:hypothetical protein